MRPYFFLAFFFLSGALLSQSFESRIHYKVVLGDTSQLHQIILLDYTKMLGNALEIENDSIYFQLRSAVAPSAIPMSEVRYLGVFNSSDTPAGRNKLFPGVPDFTDLTYERTALPLHGKGQIRVINLVYAVSEWNLNDNLQVGAGLGGPLGILLTQKLRTSITPDLHIGITGQQLWVPLVFTFDNSQIILGDIAAVLTVGNDRRFVNIGSGLLFNTDADNDESPITSHRFGIGGQIGEKWHLYGEFLMTVPKETDRFSDLNFFPAFSAAYGSKRHRWRFGVFTVFFDEDNFFPPPLPYVGYSYYW